MDGLSATASIIAVWQLTTTVLQYVGSLKGASQDRDSIYSEISGIQTTLFFLKGHAEQSGPDDQCLSTLKSLTGPEGPLDQFRSILERLEKKLKRSQGLKKIGQSIVWPFKKEEVKDILTRIERYKTLFSMALQNDHIGLSKAIKANTSRLVNDNLSSQIRNWLHAPDPSINHNRAVKSHHPGTGAWLLESQRFIQWKSASDTALWLYGKPGCGKTVLGSTVIADILDHCSQRQNVAVAYFYFDFNDVEKQKPELMIRSLLAQIAVQYPEPPPALDSLFSSCGNGQRQPTCEMLLKALHDTMKDFVNVYIILDALDECTEREELFRNVQDIFDWKDLALHVLMTSRRERDIEESIQLLSNNDDRICIETGNVSADIQAYVHGRLQTDPKLQKWKKLPGVQQEIEDALMAKADGMFRWVVCQMDMIKTCRSTAELHDALESLPRTLDDTYTRILCNIEERDQALAIRMLRWLVCSKRPLRLAQVAELVTFETDDPIGVDIGKRFLEPRDILTICSSLLSLEDTGWGNDSPIIRLAHFSVQEYLLSDRIRQGKAKIYGFQIEQALVTAANDCLAYLLYFSDKASVTPETAAMTALAREYSLLQYAGELWTHYAYSVQDDSAFRLDLAERLCIGKAFRTWNSAASLDFEYHHIPETDLPSMKRNKHPLYYAARAGLKGLCESLLDRGAEINSHGGDLDSALEVALFNSPRTTAQLLLELCEGHTELVQLLLDNGADINMQLPEDGYALQLASVKGHTETVQLLLDKGADIKVRAGYCATALFVASERGHYKVVQILLDYGADMEIQHNHVTPLQAARSKDHKKIEQLLLDRGAIDKKTFPLTYAEYAKNSFKN